MAQLRGKFLRGEEEEEEEQEEGEEEDQQQPKQEEQDPEAEKEERARGEKKSEEAIEGNRLKRARLDPGASCIEGIWLERSAATDEHVFMTAAGVDCRK